MRIIGPIIFFGGDGKKEKEEKKLQVTRDM
jgi:hypothetical protein